VSVLVHREIKYIAVYSVRGCGVGQGWADGHEEIMGYYQGRGLGSPSFASLALESQSLLELRRITGR